MIELTFWPVYMIVSFIIGLVVAFIARSTFVTKKDYYYAPLFILFIAVIWPVVPLKIIGNILDSVFG